MIGRFYADNFRCLTNFELELDQTNIFLGPNGSGKTSVFDALRKIQNLTVRGARIEDEFPGAIYPACEVIAKCNNSNWR